MGELQKNIGLTAVAYARVSGGAHPLGWGGQLARSMGRRLPFQGAAFASTPSAILGEVASGVYSADAAGVAYPAGTLWARVFTHQSTTENDTANWTAVPDTLPAGYTINNGRNIRINQTLAHSLTSHNQNFFTFAAEDYAMWGLPSAQMDSYPALTYSGSSTETSDGHSTGTGPYRSAAGVWYPYSNKTRADGSGTGRYAWGPFNYNDAVLGPGLCPVQYPGGADPVATHYNGTIFLPYSPGFRNVQVHFSITAGAASAMPPTSYIEIEVDGSGLHTYTAAACAGGLDVTWDHGPSTQQAAGDLYQTQIRVAGYNAPFGIGANVYVTCSPRVDIPLPWTCTSGNLVAPGGIVTGSIPGF